jgi:hypothetical protein
MGAIEGRTGFVAGGAGEAGGAGGAGEAGRAGGAKTRLP